MAKMVSGFKQSMMNQFDGSLLQLKGLLEKMEPIPGDPGRHNSDRNSLWIRFKEEERENELEVEVVSFATCLAFLQRETAGAKLSLNSYLSLGNRRPSPPYSAFDSSPPYPPLWRGCSQVSNPRPTAHERRHLSSHQVISVLSENSTVVQGSRMEKTSGNIATRLFWSIVSFLRRCLFLVISIRPIPRHIAFIMDGNRRYAKKRKMMDGDGHRVGFLALMSMLKYCFELGVTYVTVYAFSIENFKRNPEEVQSLMDLMQEKIEGLIKEESIVNQYGVRVHFIGNLKLLSEPVRSAAERAMAATANNSRGVLSICIAYTSTDEIVHAVQESCEEKLDEISSMNAIKAGYGLTKLGGNEENEREKIVKLTDIEKHMYMAVAPDPDVLIRTSGETRLSNFLLWQSAFCYLYSPSVLWPEIGFRHVVWAVLKFQSNYFYLERKRKQS
ncbi:hypothetical protein DVH24_037740 [Malus domestica]|uniref:Alkyl transferase n=2 Tax=Malus domestica TaxID=3750 RepID=A0A498K4F6_MALDO|nr:hypothetical protein DVH24_037740 [Malus domestica]